MSAEKDSNFQSHVGEVGTRLIAFNPPSSPTNYSDILKCSDCHGFTAIGITIPGGNEDCFDAVRGSDYTLTAVRLHPNGENGATFKGAIDGWALNNVMFERHGSRCDVEVGQFDNYWTPGRAPTRRGIILNTMSEDGKPVRVVLWDADRPTVINSNVRVIKVPWLIWFPYFLLRWAMIRL